MKPTAIIVKDGMGRPANPFFPITGQQLATQWDMFESIVTEHPCPSLDNTEPCKTVMAQLRWRHPNGKLITDEEQKICAFKCEQIWVPIVEQKEGEGKFGEWVSVKDRLPEREVWVIGYKEGQSKDDWTHPIDQRIMYYTGPGEWSGWMKDTGYTFTPTHWMPLPSPPNN